MKLCRIAPARNQTRAGSKKATLAGRSDSSPAGSVSAGKGFQLPGGSTDGRKNIDFGRFSCAARGCPLHESAAAINDEWKMNANWFSGGSVPVVLERTA